MTDEFLRAVIDTLLPGDRLDPPLPSGSTAGLAAPLSEELRSRHRTVLDAIASAAGGADAFVRGSSADRDAAMRHVEARIGDAFNALVVLALREYYEADAVVLAMGWRADPPQPLGHALPPFDETLLDPVRARGRMWR